MIVTAALTFLISTIISFLTGHGLLYWVRYFSSYVYLWFYERCRRSRFDLYDFCADDDPEKKSFFVPRQEWELDAPGHLCAETQNIKADDAFCYGVNNNSESLAVHVSRINNHQVRCSLILRLSDGSTYSLPEKQILQKMTDEPYTFGSSRLKLQCVLPMRKWRIFFNGLLKEESSDSSCPNYKHVRFTFIWTASSGVFDFTWHLSKQVISEAAASSSIWKCFPLSFIKSIRKVFNSYEQSGMLSGTVAVEGAEEKEVYLWGVRGRYAGKSRNLENAEFTEYYGTFHNGAIVHLTILNYPELITRFVCGYLMRSDGFIFPLEQLTQTDRNSSFSFQSHGWQYTLSVNNSVTKSVKFAKEFGGDSVVKCVDMSLNNKKGCGFVFTGSSKSSVEERRVKHILYEKTDHIEDLYSVCLKDSSCKNPELTGGKGSSLGKLFTLCKNSNTEGGDFPQLLFKVPNGIVVTTHAYQKFIRGDLEDSLRNFEKAVWSSDGDVEELCQKTVESVGNAQLPEALTNSIMKTLTSLFGVQTEKVKFAVRSSAVGEDSEQMSAAGQMETFLGVIGFDEIFKSLRKCWASQFSIQAVTYKRRYGQPLNSPMAVVIQEMIPCEAAGVIFTCDPVSGNPKYINITANWGLGESVVSAAAEPDTFVLERNIDNRLTLHSVKIGKKNTKIVMTGDQGTQEVLTAEASDSQCLSEAMALKLGELSVQIEECYGTSTDVEWGIIGEEVFMFQCRPVTSLDVDTDFETKHFFDTFMRTDSEFYTKANIGEVMPGATSPLGMDCMAKGQEAANKRTWLMRWGPQNIPDFPYYEKVVIYSHYQAFFNLLDGFMTVPEDQKAVKMSMFVALFGRVLDDSSMAPVAQERHHTYGHKGRGVLLVQLYTLIAMFFAGVVTRRLSKRVDNFHVPYKSKKTSEELLYTIGCHFHIMSEGLKGNIDCIMASSFWNLYLLNLLAKATGGYDSDVLSDFSYLVSNNQQVESADVPSSLEELAHTIGQCIKPNDFKAMNTKEALNWLRTTPSKAGLQFQTFLQKHGHRCVKEFDVYSRPWGDNAGVLVDLLQSLVGVNSKQSKREPESFSSIFEHMHVKLGFFSRLLLRFIIPNCRRGVREREYAKSVLIRSVNKVRQPLHRLAELMVSEGRLPDKNLLFFLTVEEINQLIKTRSPEIVTRASKRYKCYQEMDTLIFPELSCGVPRPVNLTEYIPTGDELVMTGVPVSQGVAKATARVVSRLQDAHSIQPGDILITYCTDIGWSPYFPLLAGVVTELGGLISHGAVVAREYGLPCVVGLHGATMAFKSGDRVLLDGTKGTLRKLKDNQEVDQPQTEKSQN